MNQRKENKKIPKKRPGKAHIKKKLQDIWYTTKYFCTVGRLSRLKKRLGLETGDKTNKKKFAESRKQTSNDGRIERKAEVVTFENFIDKFRVR